MYGKRKGWYNVNLKEKQRHILAAIDGWRSRLRNKSVVGQDKLMNLAKRMRVMKKVKHLNKGSVVSENLLNNIKEVGYHWNVGMNEYEKGSKLYLIREINHKDKKIDLVPYVVPERL